MSSKKLLSFLFALVLTLSIQAQDSYKEIIQAHRDSINTVFSSEEESILKEEDLEDFHGLPFYEIDEKYKVKFKFKKSRKSEEFEMQTSTSRLPVYKTYGVIKFKLDGKKYQLSVYQNIALSKKEGYEDYLFIPFTDESDLVASYAGGRYIDMTISDLKEGIIDFNLCYNPYCAYNDRYSCPIPPSENHLDTEILAGVKKWHK